MDQVSPGTDPTTVGVSSASSCGSDAPLPRAAQAWDGHELTACADDRKRLGHDAGLILFAAPGAAMRHPRRARPRAERRPGQCGEQRQRHPHDRSVIAGGFTSTRPETTNRPAAQTAARHSLVSHLLRSAGKHPIDARVAPASRGSRGSERLGGIIGAEGDGSDALTARRRARIGGREIRVAGVKAGA
jgi:hypothetical protein